MTVKAWSCKEVAFVVDDDAKLAANYPFCVNGQGNGFVAIPARWTTALSIGSTLRMSFGAAFWMAFFLHAVG